MSAEATRPWRAIVNPAAGGGRGRARAEAALARLRSEGVWIEARFTTGPGHAIELAREAAHEGVERIAAVGGDGTAFEVVNGLFAADVPTRAVPPTLAILPVGTGNSFLRDLDLQRPDDARRALARGRTRPCDLLRIEHDEGVLHSINLVGVGFTADAGARTNRSYKGLGAAGYVLAVVETALRLRAQPFPLRLDGGPLDARPAILLSFCNSRCTAGAMQMAPHADPSDGALDVIRVGPRSRGSFLASFPSIFRGTHVALPGIEEARARRVELSLDGPVDCMIDGEIRTLRLRAIEVVPAALRVIA